MIVCIEGIDNTGKTTLIKKFINKYDKKYNCIHLDSKLENLELNRNYTNIIENYKYKLKGYKEYSNDYYFYRNKFLLYFARLLELYESYDYIFIDRGFLTYLIYNENSHYTKIETKDEIIKLKDIINYYTNIVLYFPNEIKLKSDETIKPHILTGYNNDFQSFAIDNKLISIDCTIPLESKVDLLFDYLEVLNG
jgi:thymidylate kinase